MQLSLAGCDVDDDGIGMLVSALENETINVLERGDSHFQATVLRWRRVFKNPKRERRSVGMGIASCRS
jgi:hypothetical protein